MKFFVIGDADTVLGFRLTGIEGEVVQNADEALQSLERAFERQDLGIVIIPERVAGIIRKQVDQYLYKAAFPLIIEIPDRLGPEEGRGSVREMIRKAVGVHL